MFKITLEKLIRHELSESYNRSWSYGFLIAMAICYLAENILEAGKKIAYSITYHK